MKIDIKSPSKPLRFGFSEATDSLYIFIHESENEIRKWYHLESGLPAIYPENIERLHEGTITIKL